MATKTTTRIRRDLRRTLGILAEIKGNQLHTEIEAALIRHIELPENVERLRNPIKNVPGQDGGAL